MGGGLGSRLRHLEKVAGRESAPGSRAGACRGGWTGRKSWSGGAGTAGAGPLSRGSEPVPLGAAGAPPGGCAALVATPLGGTFGPALCSDAVEPNARPRQARPGATGGQAESLILAQNERWRRA